MPFFALLAFMAANRVAYAIGSWLLRTGLIDERTSFYGLAIEGARSLVETVITLNLSFLVFTFGSLLVAVQIAGGQYTPRIIATTLLKDDTIRITVSYFVFTMLFAWKVLFKMGGEIVPQFNAFIIAILGVVSIVVFLFLIDYAARFLRPVSIAYRLGKAGLTVILSVYPEPIRHSRPVDTSPSAPLPRCGPSPMRATPESFLPWIWQDWSRWLGTPAGSSNSSPR